LFVRHFEAAQGGRRTSGWQRSSSDPNAANGPALTALRELSRDLRRNNGWARRGVEIISNNTVGWGILPKPTGRSRELGATAVEIWNEWASSTACDFDGLLNFYGLQQLVMTTVAESGEALIVRQPAASVDELAIPMRLQVLEPDYLDTSRMGNLSGGGKIIDGVEFDARGQRVVG
jgi:capsid protein